MDETADIRFPESVRTVAIFGGTFDPPTRAHLELPIAVMDSIGADWLLVIPAATSPFKPGGAHASDTHRLKMLEYAFAERPHITVTTIELNRGGVSYTVDTLRSLNGAFPELSFRLIIGADQAASFHRWREAHSIIELAEPAVMLRDDGNMNHSLIESMTPHWSANELDAWRSRIVQIPTLDASSTEVRSILSSDSPDETRLLELLPPKTLAYIKEQGLYGTVSNQ